MIHIGWVERKERLKQQIALVYYRHGLFVSNHPYAIIPLSMLVAFIFCIPLANLPLPGNAPLEYTTTVKEFSLPLTEATVEPSLLQTAMEGHLDSGLPKWLAGKPVAFIQQFVVMATVSPWESRLIPTDAFRAPLSKVFSIVDDVNNLQVKISGKTRSTSDFCLHIPEVLPKFKAKGLLPEFNCLLVSPANFWKGDATLFKEDGQIIKTIHSFQSPTIETAPTIKDLLFGVPAKATGVHRFFLRNKQRLIMYAVTLALKDYNATYINTLKTILQKKYHSSLLNVTQESEEQITHMHFKEEFSIIELVPLLATYLILFLYISFSVSKIEFVKSKWGLALAAVMTVIASLLMSIGLCTLFGLTPTLNGGEIFPYLVVIVGLENILVLTKSVVSTPVHLDVNIRIAQGLSKEGWSITKNLLTELAIACAGYFTFVPAIQEFCMFALVGLLSDFSLQMWFFATVLSIDIRRIELSDLQRQGDRQQGHKTDTATIQSETLTNQTLPRPPPTRLPRSKSAPGLHHLVSQQPRLVTPERPPAAVESGEHPNQGLLRAQKRLKFVFFWARTRIVQRFIMLCTVVWIALIVYNTGLVDQLTNVTTSRQPSSSSDNKDSLRSLQEGLQVQAESPRRNQDLDLERKTDAFWNFDGEGEGKEQKEPWQDLSFRHWPKLFGCYNITLAGRYISILPPILLSVVVPPHEAVEMRHRSEQQEHAQKLQYFMESQVIHDIPDGAAPDMTFDPLLAMNKTVRLPFFSSKREYYLTIGLAVLSGAFLVVILMVLYKCVCPRDYGRWAPEGRRLKVTDDPYYVRQISDSVPLVLRGHTQDVECMCSDGPTLVSSCLLGDIRVWDANSGDCLTRISRRTAPSSTRQPCYGGNEQYDPWSPQQSPPDLQYHHLTHRGHSQRSLSDSQEQQKPKRRKSDFFTNLPNLASSIDTDFVQLQKEQKRETLNGFHHSQAGHQTSTPRLPSATESQVNVRQVEVKSTPQDIPGSTPGYDFHSRFDHYYHEHASLYKRTSTGCSSPDMLMPPSPDQLLNASSSSEQRLLNASSSSERSLHSTGSASELRRLSSAGELSRQDSLAGLYDSVFGDSALLEEDSVATPIWCLGCHDNLVVAGCSNGRIEVWDGLSGSLKCYYHEFAEGVTALCFVNNRIVASRLNGSLDFLILEARGVVSASPPSMVPSGPIRGHRRNQSHDGFIVTSSDTVCCVRLAHHVPHAHQQPINVLQSSAGRVVTGSQDHTLKVYRLEDALCLYTLHGHTDGVTALHLDKTPPLAAASGSLDGDIRLWDMLTGSCVHHLTGHEGGILSLTCTTGHVLSSGQDDRICVWDRSRGALLYSIQQDVGCSSTIGILNNSLLVSGGQGCLYLWNILRGEHLRTVLLGDNDQSQFVRQVQVIYGSSVICNYGNQLRVVHFPSVLEKAE
ncbi:PREDICTED: sterol regulatory element-binding protein cleavage-activating protein-like [Branchiostoma belcheri]|uniref:Sterol regulatory element-binding protein cleavage-activating protein n=1 Tax=Branchiostoma belcheri TaxID=7741 RepID=A0A6P4Z9D6_BRABE|nr:PREDICTED: sterol regulatory element-binding protein cleavage-activating protein-like [Branchiostoma belcheri]